MRNSSSGSGRGSASIIVVLEKMPTGCSLNSLSLPFFLVHYFPAHSLFLPVHTTESMAQASLWKKSELILLKSV